MMTENLEKPSILKNRGMRVLIFGLLGGVCGYLAMHIALKFPGTETLLDSFTAMQFIVLTISLMLIAIAAVLALMSFNRKMHEAERQSDEPIEDVEYVAAQREMRIGALGMIAMAIPLVVMALPAAEKSDFRLAVIAVSLVVQFWLSWIAWKNQDELHRKVTLEGSAIALMIIWPVVILWAALAQLGYVSAIDPLGLVLALTLSSFLPTTVLAVRRGLAK